MIYLSQMAKTYICSIASEDGFYPNQFSFKGPQVGTLFLTGNISTIIFPSDPRITVRNWRKVCAPGNGKLHKESWQGTVWLDEILSQLLTG